VSDPELATLPAEQLLDAYDDASDFGPPDRVWPLRAELLRRLTLATPSGFQEVLARFEDDTGAKLVWDIRGSPFGSGSSAWHNFLKFLASPPPHPEQP
jgi:hypothetical protein